MRLNVHGAFDLPFVMMREGHFTRAYNQRAEGTLMPIHDWTRGSSITFIIDGSMPLPTFSISVCFRGTSTHWLSSKGQDSRRMSSLLRKA